MIENCVLQNCNSNIFFELLKIIVAIVGVYLVVKKMNVSTKIKQAEYLKELYNKVFENEQLKSTFLDLDYGRIPNIRVDNVTEERVDNLLAQYNVICYLYEKKLISGAEIRLFNYRFKRVYRSQAITDYLSFLTSHYNETNVGITPFEHFVNYAQTI